MRKIVVNMMVSLDGFFEGPDRDLSWHIVDEELNNHIIGFLDTLDTFLFGRTTYELMAAYWPLPDVRKNDPLVAARLNGFQKKVFSRTLKEVTWENSELVGEFNPDEVRKWKTEKGKDMSVGGSDIAVQFLEHNLIDEFRIIVSPIALGSGKRLFEGFEHPINFKLTDSVRFKSGNVLLKYVLK